MVNTQYLASARCIPGQPGIWLWSQPPTKTLKYNMRPRCIHAYTAPVIRIPAPLFLHMTPHDGQAINTAVLVLLRSVYGEHR